MEQVKYLFPSFKSFILHHKTLSLFMGCIIILDISLIGVIVDIQQRQSDNPHMIEKEAVPSITPPARPF